MARGGPTSSSCSPTACSSASTSASTDHGADLLLITWFPIYLVKGRGLSILQVGFVATIPAICGFAGGIPGGMVSDYLIKNGHSVTLARKTRFVIGMILAAAVVGCNYVDSPAAVVAIMALAFFGKGLAAIGWAVISDASPKQIIGLTGGVFNAMATSPGSSPRS